MIFIGPGLYLFSPFTVPVLVIPTSTNNLGHAPRLIRTLLCLRYNILRKIEHFKKFVMESQSHSVNSRSKYATGLFPERSRYETFPGLLSNVSREKKRRKKNIN